MDRDERRRLAAALTASIPWWWFAVRDAGPWADVAAIFLPVVLAPVALAVVYALARRTARTAAIATSWLLFAAVTIVWPWSPLATPPPDPASRLRIVAANVLGANDHIAASSADLLDAHPDVLVVSEDHTTLHTILARSFTHATTSTGRGRGTGVYTDLPFHLLRLPPSLARLRAVRARIDAPAGPFVLYALHLPRPWPRTTSTFQVTPTAYRRLIGHVVDAVRSERLPVVVAGDLNLVDRTPEYRRLSSSLLRDAMRADWAGPTSLKWWPLLARIDHVLTEPSWCASDARRLTVTGSDHRAVDVSIGPCPRRAG